MSTERAQQMFKQYKEAATDSDESETTTQFEVSDSQARLGSHMSTVGDGEDTSTRIITNDGQKQCPYCKGWFKQCTGHWARSDCSYPPISKSKLDLIRGLYIGLGSQYSRGTKTKLDIQVQQPDFIAWLSEQLAWLSGTGTTQTDVENSGQFDDILSCNQQHRLQTSVHPKFEIFNRWETRLPPWDVTASDALLQGWFISCADIQYGVGTNPDTASIVIGTADEMEYVERIAALIEEADFGVQRWGDRYYVHEDDTDDFMDTVGWPSGVPGVEWKYTYTSSYAYEVYRECYKDQGAVDCFIR